jgi:hypothetical protein
VTAAIKAGKKLEDFSIATPAKKTAARKVSKSAK